MKKIIIGIIILIIISAFISGILIGKLSQPLVNSFSLPQQNYAISPKEQNYAISPKDDRNTSIFTECLTLVKDSDLFQKELYEKEWVKE